MSGDKEMGSSQGAQLDGLTPPSSGGWHNWTGGACPVELGTLVDVQYRDGQAAFGVPAGREFFGKYRCAVRWINYGRELGTDIIAYRLSDGGEAVHEQVSQPIRDEPKSAPTKAPSREEVAIPREMTDDMAEAICRAVNVCGGIAETIYSTIIAEQDRVTLFKGGEQ